MDYSGSDPFDSQPAPPPPRAEPPRAAPPRVPAPGVPAPPSTGYGVPQQAVGTPVGTGLHYGSHPGQDVASSGAQKAFWFGVAALVCTLSFMATAFLGPLLGVGLGIAAWIFANKELAAINAGLSSPAGASKARTGRILGLISITLSGLGLLLIIWIIAAFAGAF